jgi:hypothetical protein
MARQGMIGNRFELAEAGPGWDRGSRRASAPWSRNGAGSAFDEEARWQAYQAWRRKAQGHAVASPATAWEVGFEPAPIRAQAAQVGGTAPSGMPTRRGALALAVLAAMMSVGVMIGYELIKGSAPSSPAGLPMIATAPSSPTPCVSPIGGLDRLPSSDCVGRVMAATAPLSQSPPAPDPNGARDAVVRFYRDLGRGRVAAASELILSSRRFSGPLSPDHLVRFHAALRSPLNVTGLEPAENGAVRVRYGFVAAGGVACEGTAEVETAARGNRVYISGIHTTKVC